MRSIVEKCTLEKFLEKRGSAFNDRKRNVRAALEEFDWKFILCEIHARKIRRIEILLAQLF